jgi:hypothetical protein
MFPTGLNPPNTPALVGLHQGLPDGKYTVRKGGFVCGIVIFPVKSAKLRAG